MTDNERDVIVSEATSILSGDGSPGVRLHRMCDHLRQCVSVFDWVGFYLVAQGQRVLVLGPFCGQPTEHLKIEFGRGICGQAAEREATFVVDDVQQQSNYLSCGINVRAEIVVPIFFRDVLVGELDIDSHRVAPFSAAHRQLVEQLAAISAPLVAELAPAL
jgi:L-methionine (R)-S-oxide reductase